MELTGSIFKLRKWRENDATSLQYHADNSNVSAWLGDRFPSPYTLNDAVEFISNRIDENPAVNFAITINDEAVGGISLNMRNDIYTKTPLFGYWLSEQYWGKGIITEAINLMTAYAFKTFDIICIQACVFSENPASMRVLEKAGFVKQGILERSVIKRGQIFDEHIFAFYNKGY